MEEKGAKNGATYHMKNALARKENEKRKRETNKTQKASSHTNPRKTQENLKFFATFF